MAMFPVDDVVTKPRSAAGLRSAVRRALAPVAFAAAALIAPFSTAAADASFFITAAGQEIVLLPIADLDCVQMSAVLDLIDETGYRTGLPGRIDPADAPLFDYESRLSAAMFDECLSSDSGSEYRDGFGFGELATQ